MGLEILVAHVRAVALHEAEPLWIIVDKGAHLQQSRIGQRSPDTLTPAVQDREPFAVVHRRAVVVTDTAMRRTVQEHARQRGQSEVTDFGPRIKRGFYIHDRERAGSDGEAVSAGGRRAVEQRMHDDLRCAGRRLLDPEAAEDRELLSRWLRRIDGEAARRKTVPLATANSSKICGALEDDVLVHHVRLIDRSVNPKA